MDTGDTDQKEAEVAEEEMGRCGAEVWGAGAGSRVARSEVARGDTSLKVQHA